MFHGHITKLTQALPIITIINRENVDFEVLFRYKEKFIYRIKYYIF